MPALGADMEAGKVVQWLVKPGDQVHRGDIVAVVETEKSTIEIEIFQNGTVDELVVPEGGRVPVGAVLAHVTAREPASVPGAAPVATTATPAGVVAREPRGRPSQTEVAPTAGRHALVESPLVRHLAERLGVDLDAVQGSGPGGSVTRADVERAASAPPKESGHTVPVGARPSSSPFARRLAGELGVDLAALRGSGPGGSIVEKDVRLAAAAARPDETTAEQGALEDRQAAMRRAIGALMARSKREIPHYYLSTTIEVSPAVSWLGEVNLDRPVTERLLLPVLLLKAAARAVRRVPEMNGFFVDGAFVPSEAVHLGVAISQRSGGVIAPAIHDVEQLSLDELMVRMRDLVTRARAGRLRSSEMSDSTITVTNLGDLEVDSVFGVIYPPQVALVGFGRMREQPWAENGMLGVRPCVVATLSADHRASDGIRGGRFLTEIDHLLQEPGNL